MDALQGDPQDTFERLGWKSKTTFDELVKEMYDYDLELAQRENTLKNAGYDIPRSGAGE